MKTRFAFILDIIFVFIIAYILALVAFNFFVAYPYSLIYSGCVALLFLTAYLAKNDERYKRARLDKKQRQEIEALVSELNFSGLAEQTAILEKAFKNAGLEILKKRSSILIRDKNALVLTRFGFNPIGKADIVRAYNLITSKQTAYILSQSFSAEAVSFAERFNGRVKLIGGDKVYSYLKENDAIPQKYKYTCFFEKKTKIRLKSLLDKKKAKTFFVFGALFLLFSYISPLKVYYIVCGCAFLIYSLILKLVGRDINLNCSETDKI